MSEQEEMADDLEIPKGSAKGSKILGGLVIVALAALVVGGVGKLSGTGWFGYRTWMYEGGELYVLNSHDTPRFVSVDGLERVEVPARNAQRVELIGGTSAVEVSDKDGAVLETHAVTVNRSHALLKLEEEDCLAVLSVDPYYKKGGDGVPVVRKKIRKKDTLTILESRNVVWPRKSFPKKLSPDDGEALAVEIVGCDILDDEAFLIPYIGNRIAERFKADQSNADAEVVRPRL